ncbi:MAG: PEP-CTERM sorting domain-containing protein [Pirellulales bacterium]|nr:PEP-CTERM sorting domain-containing protein [Pirellulales bacterium]
MMHTRLGLICTAMLVMTCLFVPCATARAAVSSSGDVDPFDPTSWTLLTSAFIGKTGEGSVTVDSSETIQTIQSDYGYLGYEAAAEGTVTISGEGSSWTNRRELRVGWNGEGTLNIADEAIVSNTEGTLGRYSGSTGEVTLSGAGSTWTNSGILYIGRSGNGILTITGGAVSNSSGRIGSGAGSQGLVTLDNASSTWASNGNLYVGDYGEGTLAITGGSVENDDAYIGHYVGSNGTVTVDGADSTWTSDGNLNVGYYGPGSLAIVNSGSVESNEGRIAYYSGSTSEVSVVGTGSTWIISGALSVGPLGNATLDLARGGNVTAASAAVNGSSLITIDIGAGSLLSIGGGAGTITNDGTIRMYAGATPAAGEIFTPIQAGGWTGGGVYQAVGGVWNDTNREFVVSEVAAGTSGTMFSIDLAEIQRVRVNDSATGWAVAASFLATDASTALELTATAISDTVLDDLEAMLVNEIVLSGWQFDFETGYIPGDPAYVSFDLGEGLDVDELTLWQHDGSVWNECAAGGLTCSGAYVGLAVSNFGAYAVTGVAPTPTIPGDTNGDNYVDETDAATLGAHWGQAGGRTEGDFNNDGFINAADAAILAANWSPSPIPESIASTGASVPEPGTIAMLAYGLMVGLIRRRRVG